MGPGIELNRKSFLCAGAVLAGFCVILFIVAAAMKSKEGNRAVLQVDQASVMAQVAEGEGQAIDRDKISAYDNSSNGRRSPADLEMADTVSIGEDGMPTTAGAGESRSRSPFDGDAGKVRTTSAEQMREILVSGAEEGREPASQQPQKPSQTTRKGGSSGGGSRPMTQQQRDDKVRHDYELASEIAMRMYGVEPEAENGKGGNEDDEDIEDERVTVGQTTHPASSSAVSSLDESWGDSGLSSLGESRDIPSDDGERPYRCMFVREEKVRSGQRVTLRLLEDMVIGGVFIPANSHVSATCTIKDRLLVSVSSYEAGGRIYSLDMEGYDSDGAKGIYCPDINTSAAKTAKDDALSLGSTQLGGRMGAIASGVVRTGVSIAKSAGNGTSYVTVPAGYTFYIMKPKKNRR